MQSFGERLRKEREKQGVTLDEVCASTKIAVRFLRAIEEERFEQLPGGIFNKGFVRSYAQHLRINEQDAVADYMLAAGLVMPPVEDTAVAPDAPLPEASIGETKLVQAKTVEARKPEIKAPEIKRPETKAQVQTKPPILESKHAKAKAKHAAKQDLQPEKKKPPKPAHPPVPETESSRGDWFPWGKLAFALLLIAFGFAMWGSFHHSSEEHTRQPAGKPVINQSIGPPEQKLFENVSAEAPPVPISPPATQPGETAPIAFSLESQAALRSQDPATPGSFVVVVEAHEPAWVSIRVDGKEVMQDVLGASAQKAIEAHKEVVIKAGNVGALEFMFNGKKLPAQGDYDEVKVLTFDPNGLQPRPVKTAGL